MFITVYFKNYLSIQRSNFGDDKVNALKKEVKTVKDVITNVPKTVHEKNNGILN